MLVSSFLRFVCLLRTVLWARIYCGLLLVRESLNAPSSDCRWPSATNRVWMEAVWSANSERGERQLAIEN